MLSGASSSIAMNELAGQSPWPGGHRWSDWSLGRIHGQKESGSSEPGGLSPAGPPEPSRPLCHSHCTTRLATESKSATWTQSSCLRLTPDCSGRHGRMAPLQEVDGVEEEEVVAVLSLCRKTSSFKPHMVDSWSLVPRLK